jgi:hypothetical protein
MVTFNDTKIILRDLNAKVGKEEVLLGTIGRCSLHKETNENGIRLIDCATSKGMIISSTYF